MKTREGSSPSVGIYRQVPLDVLFGILTNPAPCDHTAELGYHLIHSARGHGYATEGAGALLRHGFSTLALPVISAVVQVDNQASHRVISRLGLRATGEITHNGMPHLRYALDLPGCAAMVEAESSR